MRGGVFHKRSPYLTSAVLLTLMIALVGLSVTCVRLIAQSTSSAVNSEALRGMQLSIEQAKNNLDYRLQQTADSARTLLGTVYPYLNSSAGIEEQLQEYSEMTRVLNEYTGKYMISRVRLYVPKDKLYSRQGETFFSLAALEKDQQFLSLVGDRRGGVFWQETGKMPTINGGIISAISCVAVVSGNKNYDQIVGALYLDIDITHISKIFRTGSTEGAELFLVNERGNIIAHPDMSRIGQAALTQEQMDKINSTTRGTMEDSSLTAYDRIDTCGWYMVASADRAVLPRPGGASASLLALLIATTLMVAMVIVMMIAYNMMLSRTASMINKAVHALESENGGAAEVGKPGRMDALSRLRTSAGKMALTAQKIVEERYQNRLAISEYQMQALQAQIKPHFLYNTMDVIKWLIADGDVENGIWMVNALSKYLRMSINKGPGAVTMTEEMALTQNYLGIMQRRFKNAFKVEMEVEPEAEKCMLPRFSLQPLVENALIHGLLHSEKAGRKLIIRAWTEGGRVLIEIEDNGSGMSEETRIQLETQEAGLECGYGVANVRKRLMLFGGTDASFKVSSREGVGTCISITLPARFGGEEAGR